MWLKLISKSSAARKMRPSTCTASIDAPAPANASRAPTLGCREFAADFELIEKGSPIPAADSSLSGTRDLGWMLHDIDFKNGRQPKFFHAVMTDGVIKVPPFESGEVRG